MLKSFIIHACFTLPAVIIAIAFVVCWVASALGYISVPAPNY